MRKKTGNSRDLTSGTRLHQRKSVIKKGRLAAILGMILLGLFFCAQPLFAAVLDLQVG